MTFTVQMRKDVNPCHSRYHPQVKVKYTDLEAGDTSLDLVVAGLGGSRIVTQAPHRPGVVWKLSTYPQDPEVKICRVFGAVTPGLIKKAGVHQLWEQGYKAKEDPLWVNLIEMEAMTPLPAELSDTSPGNVLGGAGCKGRLRPGRWQRQPGPQASNPGGRWPAGARLH